MNIASFFKHAIPSWRALLRSSRADGRTAVLSMVWPHHAKRSGYHPVSDGLGKVLQAYGMHLVPSKILQWIAGEGHESAYEIVLAMKVMRCDRLLVVDGDFQLKLIADIRRITSAKIFAVFHQIPQVLAQRVPDGAPRLLDGAICVARCQIPLVQSLAQPGRTWFVPHGVATEFFTPRLPRAAQPVVLCVGCHQRDFETLRQSAERIIEVVPTACVRLVAPRALLPSGLNLGPVQLVTDVSDEQLLEEYRRAWVVLLPLLNSTANNALLESMACGTPVVVTDVGGIRDYATSQYGALCQPGDVEAHANAAIELLRDPAHRDAAGRAARVGAEHCAWPVVRDEIRSILNS